MVNHVWRARNAEFRFLSFVLFAKSLYSPTFKNECSTKVKKVKTKPGKTKL